MPHYCKHLLVVLLELLSLHASLLQALTCCFTGITENSSLHASILLHEKKLSMFFFVNNDSPGLLAICWTAGLTWTAGLLDHWVQIRADLRARTSAELQGSKEHSLFGKCYKGTFLKRYKQHAWFFLLPSDHISNEPVWSAETASMIQKITKYNSINSPK